MTSIRSIISELIIWIISILISLSIWSPILLKIDFSHKYFVIIQTTFLIQFFRWFVFYDKVLFFQNARRKVFFFFIVSIFGTISFIEGLDLLRVLENQDTKEIVKNAAINYRFIQEEEYAFFKYLKVLLTFTTFGMSSMAIMVILKSMYRTMGYGSAKMKKYLQK